MRYAVASQLAQRRNAGTSPELIYTAPSDLAVELTRIIVCNLTAGQRDFSLFLDQSGSGTYDQTTALYYEFDLAAHETLTIEVAAVGGGIIMERGAQLAFQVGTANGVNVTVFGVPEEVAPDAGAMNNR